jgi:hypothetical protein
MTEGTFQKPRLIGRYSFLMDCARLSHSDADRRVVRLNVHGLAAELRCSLPGIRQMTADLFAPLIVDEWPDGFHPVLGEVDAYDADVVARHLSPQADRVTTFGDHAELWRDGERCWLLDDSWGLCEINLLKRSWRSWLLPATDLDPVRAVEHAILWPMSQVLMARGLSLLPAASVVHRGRGALVLSPFSLEPELSALLDAGHGLIGQRWTACREEDSRPVLLQMPGRVERSPIPQLRSKARSVMSVEPMRTEWVDLAATSSTNCRYAWCDAVLLVEPGRRAAAKIMSLSGASATAAVRRAWPMPDVGHMNRQAQLATRLAQTCGIFQIELSRDPMALLRMLEQIPADPAQRARLAPSTHVTNTRIAI